MAYTVSTTKTVFGNMAVSVMNITADAATQTIETGLKNVIGISNCPISMNSSNFHMAINSNASGVQSFGVIAITGLTSGDNLCVTVFGTR